MKQIWFWYHKCKGMVCGVTVEAKDLYDVKQKWDVSDQWNLFQILLYVLAKDIEQNWYSEVLLLEPGRDKRLKPFTYTAGKTKGIN